MIIEEKNSLCNAKGAGDLMVPEDYDGNGIGRGYSSGEGTWNGEGSGSWNSDGNGNTDGSGFGWGYIDRTFATFSD